MAWHDALAPQRMERVAVLAPIDRLRPILVTLGDAGVVEPEWLDVPTGPAGQALQSIQRRRPQGEVEAQVSAQPANVAELENRGDVDLLIGEAELELLGGSTVREGSVAALVGWCPVDVVRSLAARLAPLGASVTPLPRPPGSQPPTCLRSSGTSGAFQPLVNTYGTLPYADLNPSALAGVAYVVMFGMMFGDVGHGLLLAVLGALIWLVPRGPLASLSRLRWAVPFVLGAAVASITFGFAYGEAFGPTGLVPTLWLRPLDHTTTLLAVSLGIGATFLACAYVLGSVNRFREGGWVPMLVGLSGLAGAGLFLGLVLAGFGWHGHLGSLEFVGVAMALVGLMLGFLGLFGTAGGRVSGTMQASVELFDGVVRIVTNTVSFARLAAFGLTHAALGALVWSGTVALWRVGGVVGMLAAVVVFMIGTAVAFALEALVAGVQALRLEYYEIFSRIFTGEGRRFRPWHILIRPTEEAPCLPG